jgi:2-hydroxychromene-2-carboxylate isomerase
MRQATFYFDLGSPYAYLAAERLHKDRPRESIRWQPISLGALFKLNGRSSWSLGDEQRRAEGIGEVQRRAREYGLPPLCWPEPWPGNYLTAMRAATHAAAAGRGQQFALQAFRDAFQLGRDLSLLANVLAAAERAGLDPRELEAAIQDPQVKGALREATDAAHERGVIGVPTIAAAGELFWGDDRLQQATSRLEQDAREQDPE